MMAVESGSQIPSSSVSAILPTVEQSPNHYHQQQPDSAPVSGLVGEARNNNNSRGFPSIAARATRKTPIDTAQHSALSRQQRQVLLNSNKLDHNLSYQVSLEINEADTESISTTQHRKRKTSGTRAFRAINSPTTPRSATSHEGFYSPLSQSSPADQSYFALRPSNIIDVRSPPLRRAPASRSAHGVETSTGPPPAISTQRAFSFEVQHDVDDPRLSQQTLAELNTRELQDSIHDSARRRPSRGRSPGDRPSPKRTTTSEATSATRPETVVNMEHRSKRKSVDGGRVAIHRLSTQLNNTNLALQDAIPSGPSHEDLFLNMAQVAGGDEVGDQHGRLRNGPTPDRSPIKTQISERSSATHERRASLVRTDTMDEFRTPSAERMSARDRAYASTAHPLEGRHISRSTQLSPPARRSEASADSPSFKRTNRSSFHTRFRSAQLPTEASTFNSSPLVARHQSLDLEPSPPLPRTEGTASTVSTTAPSTVWDELDDLKARIRKLEYTGKPRPSANSNGSMERPRTAATSNTTMSSSPKRTGLNSVSPTTTGFEEISPHPLLHSALAKTKAVVSLESYRALESAAADAINLVRITSVSNTPTALERQMKRKADNMCRSLTELCIALSASGNAQLERPPTRARSSSRDAFAFRPAPSSYIQRSPEAEDRRFERSQSLDPEPTTTQRVLSRLEARRTSMKIDAINAGSAQSSPQTELHLDLKTPTQSTINRTNTVLQRRRLAEGAYIEDPDMTVRPISRATTDLNRANTTGGIDRAAKRMSREYTSNHPLPSPYARNFPGLNNVASSRRSFLGTNNPSPSASLSREKELPTTPTTPGTSRRFLTRGSQLGSSEDATSNRYADPRQRLVSAGQYSTTTRSLLSGRAGDRRSYISASGDEQGTG